MIINIPDEVQFVLSALENGGFEAYIVGGCVRDSLLGLASHDWDIGTSALPEETMSCFPDLPILKTGLRHGTITLMLHQKPYEITTYRIDGRYTDHRRPDDVSFTLSLAEDLSRRDFTVNAMAYHPQRGLVDLFGGLEDLRGGVIRAVGDGERRFREDALRIMRALRFACVYGFAIDPDTSKAMRSNKKRLDSIAAERIAAELNQLIVGKTAGKVLLAHLPLLTQIIPEFANSVGFCQNNPYHCYDVMTHSLRAVDAAPGEFVIRLALLFHDIGKPHCYTEGSNGVGHFYGHPKVGAEMTRSFLTRLRYDNVTTKTVTDLVAYHDREIRSAKHIKRWLNKLGEPGLRRLLEVKRADSLAHGENVREERIKALDKVSMLVDEIIVQKQCFSLGDLAVNGSDVLAAGVPPGREIGALLDRLLQMVMDEKVENDKEALMEIVRKTPGVIPEFHR